MKKAFLILSFTVIYLSLKAQAPAIEWQKSLGGSGDDIAYCIQQTSDGGYIVAGYGYGNGGDITGNHGGYDYWIVKLTSSGLIQWQKSLGGSNWEFAYSIVQTTDSGYIVAGYSQSTDGNVTYNNGLADFWIVKLSNSGNLQWQKSFGGSQNDIANSIIQTTDGGYIIAGSSTSNDGDVFGHHGSTDFADFWIVKINDTGVIQWQKSLGGSNNEEAYSIKQTFDGGYIVTGYTTSNDGDVIGYHGFSDRWVIKLSSSGDIQWQKCLGGAIDERGLCIQQTIDGGYIVTGASNSNDGDVSGNQGGLDFWVVKLSSIGDIQWQKCLGGTNDDGSASIQQTSDGGYITAGMTESNNEDVAGNHGIVGSDDYWVVKMTSKGDIQWQKCLGGNNIDEALSIKQTYDKGYIVAGFSKSNDGNVTGNHGNYDYWIVKLESNEEITTISNTPAMSITPNPTKGCITISPSNNVNIKVYNTLGQLIKTANNTDNISISEFPTGLYFVRLFNEQGEMIHQEKVIKE